MILEMKSLKVWPSRLWYVKMKQIKKSVEEKMNLYKVKKVVNDVEGIRIANNQLTDKEKEPIEAEPVVYDNIVSQPHS